MDTRGKIMFVPGFMLAFWGAESLIRSDAPWWFILGLAAATTVPTLALRAVHNRALDVPLD